MSGKDCVRFADLLVGLAAMQPGAVHGACVAEVRCRFIFRLYDRDANMALDRDEFRCAPLLPSPHALVHHRPHRAMKARHRHSSASRRRPSPLLVRAAD